MIGHINGYISEFRQVVPFINDDIYINIFGYSQEVYSLDYREVYVLEYREVYVLEYREKSL
ncbi:hypothetical protein FF38_00912 [Lucilia cuprina]|uniref:Uncharacterized protein n=1 Tax=Lucilia cuprina TaxID=7375 RepID=A0A0L0CHN7_LUCCU|nr:hypothetical protein FF38_00912 [Lucilia cuprina]